MLVVLAIIAVLAGVILSGQSTFNRSVILANTAYDVALSLRSAQTYGIASRGVGNEFRTGYGIEFSAGTPGSFALFADVSPSVTAKYGAGATPDKAPGDGIYSSGADTLVQTYTLNNGMTISDFCATGGGAVYCASGGSASAARIDIVFTRPNTGAMVAAIDSAGNTLGTNLAYACIAVTAPAGETRIVRISSIGQVEFRPPDSTCP